MTTRKCQNCPIRDSSRASFAQQFELEHESQGARKRKDGEDSLLERVIAASENHFLLGPLATGRGLKSLSATIEGALLNWTFRSSVP